MARVSKHGKPRCPLCADARSVVVQDALGTPATRPCPACVAPPIVGVSTATNEALRGVTAAVDAMALGMLRPALNAVREARRRGEA